MKILLIGSFRFEIYAPAFAEGFLKLGHEVMIIDYEQYHLACKNVFSKLHNRLQDRYHYGLKMREYNKSIIETILQKQPDFVFLYRCVHIYPSVLEKVKGKTILLSYNNDDPFDGPPSRWYFRHHISNSYLCDINYVYRKKNIIDYEKIGIKNTKILLPYYLSNQNKPIECEKDIPVAFVGHYENDGRDKVIKDLMDAGIPVYVYGAQFWITHCKLYRQLHSIIREPVRGKEYNLLLNRIQIALVFLSKKNNDLYTRRCFEIPAARTLMVAPYNDELSRLYPEGTCVYYRSTDELIRKIQHLLNNPEEIKRIAMAGYERLQKIGGSEIDRCSEIISDVNTIINKN